MDTNKNNEELEKEQAEEASEENTQTEKTEEAPSEEISAEQKRIEELEKQLGDEKDKYLRVAAEYDNFRKRSVNDRINAVADAQAKVITEILSVIDNFERAMDAECSDENYKKGVELTFTQIQKAFEKLGVTEIAALGETFDPNLHNAIKQVDDSDYESDKVCEVFQKGYLLGDRLIRPAMVAVSV